MLKRDLLANETGNVSNEKAVLYLDWNVGAEDATRTTEAAVSHSNSKASHTYPEVIHKTKQMKTHY